MASEPRYLMQSPVATPSEKIRIPASCVGRVSMICAICPKIRIIVTNEDGLGGMASYCGHGCWGLHEQHNRLYREDRVAG